MRLLIVGGKLQGTEAAYLAAKAGWDTVLVDRREAPPAAGIAARARAGRRHRGRGASRRASSPRATPCCPPARTSRRSRGSPSGSRLGACRFLFDLDAYRVTDVQAGVAAPVRRARRAAAARMAGVRVPGRGQAEHGQRQRGRDGGAATRPSSRPRGARWSAAGHEVVVEEYVAGPSLSLEVLAWGGRAVPLQVTGLEFDAVYDCRASWRRWARRPGGRGRRPRRRLRLGCRRRRRRARRLRRRLRARRRGPRPQRPDGRRGHGGGGGAASCSRSTPACPARRRRPSTGRAGSTSSSCCCRTVLRRGATGGGPGARAAPACTSTCAPREVCWTSSAST